MTGPIANLMLFRAIQGAFAGRASLMSLAFNTTLRALFQHDVYNTNQGESKAKDERIGEIDVLARPFYQVTVSPSEPF